MHVKFFYFILISNIFFADAMENNSSPITMMPTEVLYNIYCRYFELVQSTDELTVHLYLKIFQLVNKNFYAIAKDPKNKIILEKYKKINAAFKKNLKDETEKIISLNERDRSKTLIWENCERVPLNISLLDTAFNNDLVYWFYENQLIKYNFQDLFDLLVKACQKDAIKIAALILTINLDLNQIDKNDNSALLTAAKYKSLKIIELLIQKGANVNVKDKNRTTPLIAIMNSNIDLNTILPTIELLMAAGSDAAWCDYNGDSATSLLKAKKKSINLSSEGYNKLELLITGENRKSSFKCIVPNCHQ